MKYFCWLPTLSVISVLFIGSCAAQAVPYLSVDVQPSYNSRHLNVNYTFESEKESHKCRIIIIKEDGTDGEIVYNEDRWLFHEGDLHFELDNGFYTLQFTVLSERGGRFYELAFLSEEYSFSIQDPYVEEEVM